ncbi:hypothetical protein [Rhodococcus sp. NPDC058514]|uniref:hypothetical protein n=1 Tax=unclassified Rhodococcus (in: high G+C Gram-positive bacteria) TaxID=192944 RepID=UPI0036550CCE
MSTRITKTLAATAIALTVGVFAAPAVSAAETAGATPAMGSVALCFSIPLGSAALVWCL